MNDNNTAPKQVVVNAVSKDAVAESDNHASPMTDGDSHRHDSDVSDDEMESLPMQIMPGDVGKFTVLYPTPLSSFILSIS